MIGGGPALALGRVAVERCKLPVDEERVSEETGVSLEPDIIDDAGIMFES